MVERDSKLRSCPLTAVGVPCLHTGTTKKKKKDLGTYREVTWKTDGKEAFLRKEEGYRNYNLPWFPDSASLGCNGEQGAHHHTLYNYSQTHSTWLFFWFDVIGKTTPLTGRHRMLIVLGGGRSLGQIPSKPNWSFTFTSLLLAFPFFNCVGILLSYTKLGLHSNSFPEKVICQRLYQGGRWLRHRRQAGVMTDRMNTNYSSKPLFLIMSLPPQWQFSWPGWRVDITWFAVVDHL